MGRRGPQLPKGEDIRRRKLSLLGMYPTALRNISKAINADPPCLESSWKVVAYVEGLPRQRQEIDLTGRLSIQDMSRFSEEELEALAALARRVIEGQIVPPKLPTPERKRKADAAG